MSTSYTKTNWQDAPSTATPITAAQLNRMEKGIEDCSGQGNANELAIAANAEAIRTLVDEKIVVDQTYNKNSQNAQSGIAVAGAISNLVSLEDNTEWIFDGGDASGSVEIDLVIDGEMSDTSNNPVSNKVIKKYVDNMVDLIYPVGSIYMSANDTSPSILFGGEWERIKDRFLLAAGDTYSAGSIGGEAAHKLTVAEMPSHEGHLYQNVTDIEAGPPPIGNLAGLLNKSIMTAQPSGGRGWNLVAGNEVVPAGVSRGGDQPHNNMPPYLAVYMWKRIA